MACKTESKVINEHEYSVTQWPADKALLMKFRLGKVLGPALTSLAGALKVDNKGDTDTQDVMSSLSDGLSVLFEHNAPEDIVKLIKDTVIGAARDGVKITDSSFTELFSGDDLMESYKVFIFVLQVNYKNFFKGQLADRLLAQVKDTL